MPYVEIEATQTLTLRKYHPRPSKRDFYFFKCFNEMLASIFAHCILLCLHVIFVFDIVVVRMFLEIVKLERCNCKFDGVGIMLYSCKVSRQLQYPWILISSCLFILIYYSIPATFSLPSSCNLRCTRDSIAQRCCISREDGRSIPLSAFLSLNSFVYSTLTQITKNNLPYAFNRTTV